ncbi:unnamed protein product [Periconia digitata]|uniref:Zn(2)-C6 fungal-type domain-containing protein n=1 Tax=Periconia digitata TaxID=1303443 RepID=A0A9W4XLJ3_9PLEO|nr:unnamed protein product [Periconia digitata]
MTDGRPILPRLFHSPTAGADHVGYHPYSAKLTSQRKVSVACRICQARRTKCDGARPQCGACTLRQSECGYTTKAGQSHSQARKQKMQELENDKRVMLTILCHLQTTSSDEAGGLLKQLRSIKTGDVDAMLASIGRDQTESFSTDHSFSSGIDMDDADGLTRRLSSATTLTDYPQSPSSTRCQDATTCFGIVQVPPEHDLSIDTMRAALDLFFTCASSMSFVFDQLNVGRLVDNIASHAGPTFLGLYNKSVSLEATTELSELAGMLAVGILYMRAEASETAPSSDVASFYYSIGRQGLDSAIEYSPLRAMRLCALLAFYNLSLHPSVASAYIGLGLNLAHDNGVDTSLCSSDISHESVKNKQMLRTLVHLQCWLSASMDFVPESLYNSLVLMTEQTIDDKAQSPWKALQHQVVKITIIKQNILHGSVATSLEPTAAHYREKLSSYRKDLPHWMSLNQLIADGEKGMSKDPHGAVLYLHLFYMSTMMSLSRRLLAAHISKQSAGNFDSPMESRLAVEEGFMAAQMTARVLDLMHSEGSVIDACWLCIHRYTAYTACIMITYCAVQKALNGLDVTKDVELILRCLRILSCCAQKDELSGVLLLPLSKFTTVLQAHEKHWAAEEILKTVNINRATEIAKDISLGDLLLTPHSGTTELHAVSRDLLSLMHRTFGSIRVPPQLQPDSASPFPD